MTPIEIKSYFENNPPPESFELKPWAKITNSAKFLQSCYNALANYKGKYEDCPDYWRLKEFYLKISNAGKPSE